VGRRLSHVDRDSHGKATLKPNQEIPIFLLDGGEEQRTPSQGQEVRRGAGHMPTLVFC